MSVSRCYSLEKEGWIQEESLHDNRKHAAASVTADGSMIVTGGCKQDCVETSKTTEVYSRGQWSCGTPLPVDVQKHCQVYARSKTFVIGKDHLQ